MSRIGRKPVVIPEGVIVDVHNNVVSVSGPKGSLKKEFHPTMKIDIKDNSLIVSRHSDDKFHRSLHGLTRSLLANMVEGVVAGFKKALEIQGTGYRAQLKGDELIMQLGYSQPVVFKKPDGINFELQGTTKIVVTGVDKELVGETARRIKAFRKVEPYKGKGIRYEGEWIKRKVGKKGV